MAGPKYPKPPRRIPMGMIAGCLVATASLLGVERSEAVDALARDPGGTAMAAESVVWTPPTRHFARAALEVVGINMFVWSYDRFIRDGGENPEFRVGTNSIWDNMKNRFEWDNNSFGTNNFAHPYHGNLSYNAARSNGYDYWESIPFAFAGSYLWEFAGERNNPAYNDWINTSVGGIVIGESLYRLSDLLLDNTARGRERFWRELGGLVLNPIRGVNRIISGEWSRVGPNAPDHRPDRLVFRMEGGLRRQNLEEIAKEDTSGAFVTLDFLYGDPFSDDQIKPFDDFSLSLQLNFNEVSRLGRFQIQGVLFGTSVHQSQRAHHILGGYQYFEYIDNRGFEFGGQSVGATLLSRYGAEGSAYVAETNFGLGLLLLGGTSSEVANFSGRDYDYGSGLTYRAGAHLHHRGRIVAEFRSEGSWLYTLNGLSGHYFINITSLQAMLPLWRSLGAGVEWRGYYRKAWYSDFENISRWFPEVRGFIALGAG